MMKNFIFITTIILTTLNGENSTNNSWKLVSQSDGVSSYERWIVVSDKLSVRERMSEFFVRNEPKEIVQLITKPELVQQWMKNIKQNTVYKKINENEFYQYTVFELPWPFDNRDLVAHYYITANMNNEFIKVNIESKENLLQKVEGISRIEKYKAEWTVKKYENVTKVVFNAITYTPPTIPRYIQDPILERTFHQNMLNLKSRLEMLN